MTCCRALSIERSRSRSDVLKVIALLVLQRECLPRRLGLLHPGWRGSRCELRARPLHAAAAVDVLRFRFALGQPLFDARDLTRL